MPCGPSRLRRTPSEPAARILPRNRRRCRPRWNQLGEDYGRFLLYGLQKQVGRSTLLEPRGKPLSKWWIHAATGFLLIAACACNFSSPTKKVGDEKPAGAPAQNAAGPGINLNCIFDGIQNPTEAFHYSYSRQGQSAFIEQEVDVTPQTMDGSVDSMRATHARGKTRAGFGALIGSAGGLPPGSVWRVPEPREVRVANRLKK